MRETFTFIAVSVLSEFHQLFSGHNLIVPDLMSK